MAVDPLTLTDPAKIRTLLENARRLGNDAVVAACMDRLIALGAEGSSVDPVEIDCWKGVFAAQAFATRAKQRTVRLNRTRQKIARVGIVKTIADLAGSAKIHQGFEILRDGGRLDLSFEAIALRYPTIFDEQIRRTALEKLSGAGYSTLQQDRSGIS